MTFADVCSNWGNWVAAAGMTGGRINHFNITKQSKARGTLCLTACPACATSPAEQAPLHAKT